MFTYNRKLQYFSRFGGLNAPLRSGKHTSFEGGVGQHIWHFWPFGQKHPLSHIPASFALLSNIATQIHFFFVYPDNKYFIPTTNQVRVPAFAVDLSGGKYLGPGGRDYPHMVKQYLEIFGKYLENIWALGEEIIRTWWDNSSTKGLTHLKLQISAFFLFSNFQKRQIALYSPCRSVGWSVGRRHH